LADKLNFRLTVKIKLDFMTEKPLISCLCVTHNKLNFLQRVIRCFKAQTYTNKELVIVYESDNFSVQEFSKSCDDTSVTFYEIPATPKQSLGTLRNISLQYAKGDYFCQWDDDDWYAEDRLDVQYDALKSNVKVASMLTYWLMFDSMNNQAFLSPFRLWEGSILCEKAMITSEVNYANLEKGEDTVLLGKLLETNCIFPIIKPNIYIYVFHGDNTWDYDHFNKFYTRGLQLPFNITGVIKEILDEKHTIHDATEIMNSESFLKEISYRYELIDRYRLQLV